MLEVRFVGRERLDLPKPLGKKVPTVIVEPVLAEGTGLFVKEGRLKVWLTDDARRIPVRMRAKVAIGSVSADLESYTPGDGSPLRAPACTGRRIGLDPAVGGPPCGRFERGAKRSACLALELRDRARLEPDAPIEARPAGHPTAGMRLDSTLGG